MGSRQTLAALTVLVLFLGLNTPHATGQGTQLSPGDFSTHAVRVRLEDENVLGHSFSGPVEDHIAGLGLVFQEATAYDLAGICPGQVDIGGGKLLLPFTNEIQLTFVDPITGAPAVTRAFGTFVGSLEGPSAGLHEVTLLAYDLGDNLVGAVTTSPTSPDRNPDYPTGDFLGIRADSGIHRLVLTNDPSSDIFVMGDFFVTSSVPECSFGDDFMFEPLTTVGELSTVSAEPEVVSSFGGLSTITVTVENLDGNPLPGLDLEIQALAGTLLGSVVDHGDGSYSQDLEAGPGVEAELVVSFIEVFATVGGFDTGNTATVTVVPVDAELSTIQVDPDTVFLGRPAVVTVTPSPLTLGAHVVVLNSQGTVVGTAGDDGDGSYSLPIDGTQQGTVNFTATVNGLLLNASASFTVLDPFNIFRIIGVSFDGTTHGYMSIQQAVDNSIADSLETIFVTSGTYPERVLIKGRTNLTLIALTSTGPVVVTGFVLSKSSGITLHGFEVDANSGRHGVKLKGGKKANSDVLISDCYVHGALGKRHGIVVDKRNSDVTIDQCTVADNGRNGLSFKKKGGPYFVTDSVIEGNGFNGARVGKKVEVTFEYNTIRDNGRYGIRRDRVRRRANPEQVTLIQNVFSGNGGRIKPGRSDLDLKNYDQIIDVTDDQPPYTP